MLYAPLRGRKHPYHRWCAPRACQWRGLLLWEIHTAWWTYAPEAVIAANTRHRLDTACPDSDCHQPEVLRHLSGGARHWDVSPCAVSVLLTLVGPMAPCTASTQGKK